uniref:Envelope glycoprotein Q n=2 Tax=Roseolovirus TaxID=40272 RepID=A0A219XWN8_HHV6H|nr:envelope glycoprotein Q [Human betaherpesvirus 6B]
MRPPRCSAPILVCAISMATALSNATVYRDAGTVESTPPPDDEDNYTAKYYDDSIYFNIYDGTNPTPRRRTLPEIISKFSTSEMSRLGGLKAFVPVDYTPTTTLEDIEDLLNYAICDDNSCGCLIETEARIMFGDIIICVPLSAESRGVRNLKNRIMPMGLSQILSSGLGLHFSLLYGAFGSNYNSLAYMGRLKPLTAMTAIAFCPMTSKLELRQNYRLEKARCELIVNIELLKIQNHGGQTIKTLTSFAIVRKDNDGQDWETCTRFASVSIEDILRSKPAANGTCCPPRDVHHNRPTLQSSNSWTRTEYFEPWQDVVDAYVPINDNHCPNDSYVVFQTLQGHEWCSRLNKNDTKNYLSSVLAFKNALYETEELMETIGMRLASQILSLVGQRGTSIRNIDPAIVSALWHSLPEKLTTTNIKYDIASPTHMSPALCTIFVQTGTSKQRFRNAGLLMVNNIFTAQARYSKQNMFEKKIYGYEHLGQALCEDGEILFQNAGQKFCRPFTDNRTIVYTMQDQVQRPWSVTWMDLNLVISDYGRAVIENLTENAMSAHKNGPRYLQMETFISDLFRYECHRDNRYVLEKKLQMFYPTTHMNELLFYPSDPTLPSPYGNGHY